MPLGIEQQPGIITPGDTAELYGSVRLDDGPTLQKEEIASVQFIVQRPDGTTGTQDGVVLDDGQGYCRWTDTSQDGVYVVQIQFTLITGQVLSVIQNFTVSNPFLNLSPSPTDLITEGVWLRFEDLFDSISGGPWLRDETMNNFSREKIARFVPEALMNINIQMPPTNFTIDMFTQWTTTPGDNPNMPLLIQSTLVLTIKHLMRSYVEQPTPQGGQVVWHDRTRYTQMWSQVYQFELQEYKENVRLWKRTTLNLGHSALSVFSKSGRMFPYSNQAARGAYRGFY